MIDIADLLRQSHTIAVVGLSQRPDRTSHKIAAYLQEVGYRIVPVNPHAESLLGETAYPSLEQIPESINIDIVDVFRRPQFMPGIVEEAIARRERTGQNPVIWTQIGVSSFEAEQRADEAGIPYVRNRCTLVEHSQLAF